MQMRGIRLSVLDERVDGHSFQTRDVSESDGLAEETQDVGAAGASKGTTGVVGGGTFPFAETGGFCRGDVARGVVGVG